LPQSYQANTRALSAAVMVVGNLGMFPLEMREREVLPMDAGVVNSPVWW
jgi:hypothetical protein